MLCWNRPTAECRAAIVCEFVLSSVGTPRCGVRTAQRAVPTIALHSPQSETVIGRFPKPQTNELLIGAMVDLRPKRAHDVFTSGRDFTEIFRLQIEMSILPGLKRFFNGVSEGQEIIECSTSFIVLSTDRCLGEITMAVAEPVIALAVELRVVGLTERRGMQTMRGMERHLHPEKNAFVIPYLGEKIVPFMQADAMQRQQRIDALVNVPGEAFRRHRPIFHPRHLLVQEPMIEFSVERFHTMIDIVITNERSFAET